nr:MAG TPA: hypothetical protein [Cressdnaviricota sp.]
MDIRVPIFYGPPGGKQEVVMVSPALVAAIKRSPKLPSPKDKELKPILAYANPEGAGYGSDGWPFDKKRAYTDGRYRAGIRNAMNADWTSQNWKFEARRLLQTILEDLLAAEEVFEAE